MMSNDPDDKTSLAAAAPLTPQDRVRLGDLLGGYTWEQIDDAFEKVQNKDHWKGPIYVVVPIKDEAEKKLIAFAIEFFTATTATFTYRGAEIPFQTFWLVEAPGYWAGPAN